MDADGISAARIRDYLSLGCVQSVYHWLEGRTVPTLDNFYALSVLFHVPMDDMIFGMADEVCKSEAVPDSSEPDGDTS